MDENTREILSALSNEERVERMRGLLVQIKSTGMCESVPLGQFIDLYEVHDTSSDEFIEGLDIGDDEFSEGTFDDIVEAYDTLTGYVDPSLNG
jgi:hypothetical protein